jgi:hypothetical protein
MSADEDRGKKSQEILGKEVGAEATANYQRYVEAREPLSDGEK